MSQHERREYLKTALTLLAFVAFLGLLGALRDFRHDFDEGRNDTRCILHELNEHRQNNYRADIRQAEAIGARVDDLPPPPSLPPGTEWDKACDGILGESGPR